jgi:hypothetical protein
MPPDAGPVLRFAQPVLMRVLLTNKSGRTIEIPKFMLDPKAGFLEVLIRRVNSGAVGRASTGAESFTPLMQRCFQWDAADSVRLGDGESMEDNINLTFGSGGFAFAEPGTYDVTTLLVLFDENQQRELIASSNTVRIRIGAPRSDDEERDAMQFFTPDVGMYLALGGSAALDRARDTLDGIADRRKNDLNDPLVAHIVRVRALDSGRSYVRYRDRDFHVVEPDLPRATSMLEAVRDQASQAFDAATARQTANLVELLHSKASGKETVALSAIGPSVLPPDASASAIRSARSESYSMIGKERVVRWSRS